MSFLIDQLSGLVLSTSQSAFDVPLDFVLEGPGGVVIVTVTWWMDPYGWSGKVEFAAGKVEPHPSGWQLKRDDAVSILFASPDPDDLPDLTNARFQIDTERATYLAKLAQLKDYLGPDWAEALTKWETAVKARPERDAVAEHIKAQTATRQVGLVTLVDQDGEFADLLAIDGLGNAVTVAGNSWLESIGGQWVSIDGDRPSIVDFLTWVSTQRPYGPVSIKETRTVDTDGRLEGIAFASVPRTV